MYFFFDENCLARLILRKQLHQLRQLPAVRTGDREREGEDGADDCLNTRHIKFRHGSQIPRSHRN